MKDFKKVLFDASTEAGKIIRSSFNTNFEIESKDIISNLVTEVDKASEAKIIGIIKKSFPEHAILSEEIGELGGNSEVKWIIDPIDGTVNFAHAVPICAVSIGIEIKGEVVMGVVYNPISEEFFYAQKNEGAFLNDKRISVSKENDLLKSLLVTGFPYQNSTGKGSPHETFGRFLNLNIPIRRLGSAALDLCWTACGRFDGFWEYKLNPWDTAAGACILKEAGGMLSDFRGGEYSIYHKQILATNSHIHSQMIDVMKISG
jgi:myo-inositol-1(or 4)-monophosphatase